MLLYLHIFSIIFSDFSHPRRSRQPPSQPPDVWPAAGRWLGVAPTCEAMGLSTLRMQVALRRRLWWLLPVGPRRCNGQSCLRVLDALRDHWASCPRPGRLRRRARPEERAWARVLREGGAFVRDNVLLRDTNLGGISPTGRRQKVSVARSGQPHGRRQRWLGCVRHRGVNCDGPCTLQSRYSSRPRSRLHC